MLDFEKNNYRHELKFLCTEKNLYLAENRIQYICKLDIYAGIKGYIVRSLYFDTYENACYYENKAGADHRRKYRIRIYNSSADMIKLECKYSLRDMKAKTACQITREQCQCLIEGRNIRNAENGQELLRYFLFERSLELFVPKVIVEYERVPYVYPFGNVRITFDRKISSSSDIHRFLEQKIGYRCILSQGMHIMEVKYNGKLPDAIREILVGNMQLTRTSFSKYTLCREYAMK